MKKTFVTLLTLSALVFGFTQTAYAAQGEPPQGSCPGPFETHVYEDHTGHENHIGITVDLNGDGSICVLHLDNGLHVHMDDVVR